MDVEAYKDLFGTRRFTSYGKLSTGKVVQFTYDNEQKYAVVLDPEWEGKMHALSLKSLSPDSLKTLLSDLKDMTSRDEVYANYKSSQYTEARPYRTYTISKISSLREIYLKTTTLLEELKIYGYIREYDAAELIDAAGEYFENEYTFSTFPNLAENQKDFITMLNAAPKTVLNRSQLLALENSNVEEVLRSKNPMNAVKQMMREQERDSDLKRILDGINSKVQLPLPIVIKYGSSYYLLGGNSRLSTLAALGYTMPVKLLTYRGK